MERDLERHAAPAPAIRAVGPVQLIGGVLDQRVEDGVHVEIAVAVGTERHGDGRAAAGTVRDFAHPGLELLLHIIIRLAEHQLRARGAERQCPRQTEQHPDILCQKLIVCDIQRQFPVEELAHGIVPGFVRVRRSLVPFKRGGAIGHSFVFGGEAGLLRVRSVRNGLARLFLLRLCQVEFGRKLRGVFGAGRRERRCEYRQAQQQRKQRFRRFHRAAPRFSDCSGSRGFHRKRDKNIIVVPAETVNEGLGGKTTFLTSPALCA